MHHVLEIFAYAVHGWAALHFHARFWHTRKFHSAVRLGEYGFGQIFSHFRLVHVKSSREFYVADAIAAYDVVHYPGHGFAVPDALVELHSLNKRRRAVSHARDCNPYLGHEHHNNFTDCKILAAKVFISQCERYINFTVRKILCALPQRGWKRSFSRRIYGCSS